MKFYKTENNELYAYEDNVPEFGACYEMEIKDDEGNITIEKVYPEFTVKEGLTPLTIEEYQLLSNPPISNEGKRKEEVPQLLSRFQAVRVLKSFKVGDNNLYKLTDNYIKSLDTDVEANDEIVDAWELAQEFRRDSNTILAAQKQFDLTDEQVDKMFIDGSKITA